MPDRPRVSLVIPRFWTRLALAQVAGLAMCVGYWLYQTEFAFIDVVRLFDYVGGSSWADVVTGATSAGSPEFRSLQLSLIKLVHDVSGGPSQVVFRTLQLALVMLLVMFFFVLLRPRTPSTWFGFTVGSLCLVGLHTARPVLLNGIPLGHALLLVTTLLLGSLVLLRRRPGALIDGLAAVLSLVALFYIEGGVIVAAVWIVAGVGRLGAARRSTAAGVFCVLAVYGVMRFLFSGDAIPGAFQTETGVFFTENLPVDQQAELFEGLEWVFFGYNAVSTLLTVLLSEPRAGVFYAVDAVVNGTPVRTWQVINWVTSTLSTLLIIVMARTWWRSHDAAKRTTLILGVVVLLVNAALGHVYTRDRIPSVAGVYYALVLGMATTTLWERRSAVRGVARRLGISMLLATMAMGWTYRAVGTMVWARDAAWSVRDEWTDRYERLTGGDSNSVDRRTADLRNALRQRALRRALADPSRDPAWMSEFFERTR